MELFVCVINRPELLDDVLTGLIEAGVPGCTIVDSHGMGKFIAQDIPIFSGFKSLFAGARESNYMIFSVIKDKETMDTAIDIVLKIYGSFDEPNSGILFTLPVSRCFGLSGQRD